MVEPYEITEFKKLLSEALNKFTLQNEMHNKTSLDMARSSLFLSSGKTILTLILANEYIKLAQKNVIDIVARARN
jgi:hypothetical protein